MHSPQSKIQSKRFQAKVEKAMKSLEPHQVKVEELKQQLSHELEELIKVKSEVPRKISLAIDNDFRQSVEPSLNIPNFLIIGVQKGGTTWLHEILKRHPQILLPRTKKEMEFFSYYDKRMETSGILGYLRHFNQLNDIIKSKESRYKAIGEATPGYFWSINPARKWTNPPEFFNENIPGSVLSCLGKNVKLILCLRNPVKRAVSAYLHHIRRGRISYRTQSIIDIGHLYGIIDMGFYYQHMMSWLKYFSMDNFKILIYEQHISNHKEETVQSLCEFLKIDYNLYPIDEVDLSTYYNQGLRYRFTQEGVFISEGCQDNEFLLITQEQLQELKEIYYQDFENLQNLLNLNLVDLWNMS